jgi:hypothetical protein
VDAKLVSGTGVMLRWPDGEQTRVIDAAVTGLGTSWGFGLGTA